MGRPMGATSYRAVARRLRKIADGIEARSDYDRRDQHQLAGMSNRLAALALYVRLVRDRHSRG